MIAAINSKKASSQLDCDSNVNTSREGSSSIHERCHLDSNHYGNQEYKAGKLFADVKSYEPPHL